MTIPASRLVPALLAANRRSQLTDENGVLTSYGQNVLSQAINFVQGMNRIIPCNATGTNLITLTLLSVSPFVTQYCDFDTFRFVAANTSTGLVSASVVIPQGTLTTLNVYKSNGAAQATTGDITAGLQYDLTYVDSLNASTGGFVLR